MPEGLPVTASIGLVVAQPGDGSSVTLDLLVRAADHAMYEAKSAGGNRVAAGPY